MRILIVGLGSIGRRHLKNVRVLLPEAQIVVWRRQFQKDTYRSLDDGGDQIVCSLKEALATHPDVALITNPAALHIETGLALAEHGVDLFIEKPLSHTLAQVDTLLQVCKANHLILMVGYHLRFYEPLRALKQALDEGEIGQLLSFRAEVGQYLPDWRPDSDYRLGVSAQEKLGGGAVLELSHELDYAHWLVGAVRGVSAQVGKLSDLDMDVEDSADIMLQFESGVMGNIHLDMLQRSPVRQCRLVGRDGTLEWDGLKHQVRLFSAKTGAWSDVYANPSLDYNQMYIDELKHFFSCVQHRDEPLVNGKAGQRVLEIALAVKKSSQIKQMVMV